MMRYLGSEAGKFVGEHPGASALLTGVGLFGTAVLNQALNYAANPQLFFNESNPILTEALGLNIAANAVIPVSVCLALLANHYCGKSVDYESIQSSIPQQSYLST